MLYSAFIRKESAKKRSVSTGSALLDRAFGLPLESFIMLRGDSSAGKTAIALELAKAYLNLNLKNAVLYFDIKDSIYVHRMQDLQSSRMIVGKPQDSSEIIASANALLSKGYKPLVVLDSVNLLDAFRDSPESYDNFARNLKSLGATSVISLATRKHRSWDIWAFVIDISIHKTKIVDGKSVGHEVLIKGPLGETVHYIEYESGRLSEAYEHATLEVEAGKAPAATFTLNGVTVKGFWNFVNQYTYRKPWTPVKE